ncbi:MAG: hypothetical protein WAL01_20085, partial [Pseudolabrys sp.]
MTVVQSGGLSRVHCWHKADIEDYRRFALGHYWTVVQLPPEPSCGFDRNRVTATEFFICVIFGSGGIIAATGRADHA